MTPAEIDALEAGPVADALVAERVMGTPFGKPRHGNCCTCQTCGWPHDECKCGYSDDIEMAWKVVEKLGSDGHAFQYQSIPSNGHHDACFDRRADGMFDADDIAEATTAPLAITRAALKALEAGA